MRLSRDEAEPDFLADLPEGIPTQQRSTLAFTTTVTVVASQRAYMAVSASRGGVDGAEVPRSGREKYVELHRCYHTVS